MLDILAVAMLLGYAMYIVACLLIDASLSYVSCRVMSRRAVLYVYLFVNNCESKVLENVVFSLWNDAFVNEEHPFTRLLGF